MMNIPTSNGNRLMKFFAFNEILLWEDLKQVLDRLRSFMQKGPNRWILRRGTSLSFLRKMLQWKYTFISIPMSERLLESPSTPWFVRPCGE
jgi:hypothetical protein